MIFGVKSKMSHFLNEGAAHPILIYTYINRLLILLLKTLRQRIRVAMLHREDIDSTIDASYSSSHTRCRILSR